MKIGTARKLTYLIFFVSLIIFLIGIIFKPSIYMGLYKSAIVLILIAYVIQFAYNRCPNCGSLLIRSYGKCRICKEKIDLEYKWTLMGKIKTGRNISQNCMKK